MTVKFYKYGSNIHGFFIQTEKLDKTENLNKSDLLKIADLRHPVLNRVEFYNTLSTDRNGQSKKEFSLMTSTHYLKIEL